MNNIRILPGEYNSNSPKSKGDSIDRLKQSLLNRIRAAIYVIERTTSHPQSCHRYQSLWPDMSANKGMDYPNETTRSRTRPTAKQISEANHILEQWPKGLSELEWSIICLKAVGISSLKSARILKDRGYKITDKTVQNKLASALSALMAKVIHDQ